MRTGQNLNGLTFGALFSPFFEKGKKERYEISLT